MNINWSSVIQALIVPLGIATVFWGLSKVKALKPKKEQSTFDPSESDVAEYQSYMKTMSLITIGCMVSFGFGLYYILLFLSRAVISMKEPFDAVLPLPNVAYAIPALFGGLILAHFPTEYLSNRIYGEEKYSIFKKIMNKQYGFDMERVTKGMVKGGLVLTLLFFLNAVKTTTYLYGEHIEINGFTTIKPIKKPLSDLKEIVLTTRVKAPNGNIVGRLKYHIIFRDGFIWDFDQKESQGLIKVLQFKTATPYREAEML